MVHLVHLSLSSTVVSSYEVCSHILLLGWDYSSRYGWQDYGMVRSHFGLIWVPNHSELTQIDMHFVLPSSNPHRISGD